MFSSPKTSIFFLFGLPFLLFANSCSSSEQLAQPEVQQDFQPERPIPYPLDISSSYLAAIDEGSRTRSGEPGPGYWQNEARYSLNAELIPEENRLNGRVNIDYLNNSPDDLEQLVLELAQNLHKAGVMKKENTEITGGIALLEVTVRGETVDVINREEQQTRGESGYLVDATRMLIVLDEPLNAGDSIDLEISWSFEVPDQGASGRMGKSRGNLFHIAYWYPKMSVYDDVNGWFTDPFLGNAEFYHGFADYELEITLPDNWLVMATGELLNARELLARPVYDRYTEAGESDEIIQIVSESDFGAATRRGDDGTLTWNFRAEKVRDVAFSATTESVWDGTRASVGDLSGDGTEEYTRIHTFYRQSASLWQEQAEYAQHSITFLSDYLNRPYPWPHMTSVEGADIIGGGMEFPMMTIMGSYENMGAERLYEVTAHELAHMWYPMIVSTNERRYTWMDEGFTTFNTHQAQSDYYPGSYTNSDVFRFYLGVAGTDLEGPLMRWSDFHYPGPAYGVASYPKPASILTALQGILEEDIFTEAYETFLDEWAYKHPYPWDFFNTVERVAETDLDWFWRSWYYETWSLDQAVGEVEEHDDGVTIEIEDLGNVPMPVNILVILEDGTELETELSVDPWLQGKRTSSVTLDTDQPVAEIIIDPDLYYPDADRSNNYWEAEEEP
ncbi:MAG: M1 family metallopeptidase [Balneolaceae bacterium]